MDRAELLGQMMSNYHNSIAVSGTHGKTTTTSMLSLIMLAGECDPTISVGGILKDIDGNIRVGRSQNFITEACEYTNSFLKFNPRIELILNVDADHLDFFKDLNDIRHSFRCFAEKLDEKGVLIINGEIPNRTYFTENLPCKVITYGLDSSDTYTAKNITFDDHACGSYDLYANGEKLEHMTLSVTGMHNVSNSLAAIAAAMEPDGGEELSTPENLVRLPAPHLHTDQSPARGFCQSPFPRRPCRPCRHLCRPGSGYRRDPLQRSAGRNPEIKYRS